MITFKIFIKFVSIMAELFSEYGPNVNKKIVKIICNQVRIITTLVRSFLNFVYQVIG